MVPPLPTSPSSQQQKIHSPHSNKSTLGVIPIWPIKPSWASMSLRVKKNDQGLWGVSWDDASDPLASSTHTNQALNPCPRSASPWCLRTLPLDTRVRLVQKGLEGSSIMSQLEYLFFKEIFADILDIVTGPNKGEDSGNKWINMHVCLFSLL